MQQVKQSHLHTIKHSRRPFHSFCTLSDETSRDIRQSIASIELQVLVVPPTWCPRCMREERGVPVHVPVSARSPIAFKLIRMITAVYGKID